jgi:hypothetical protein
MFTCCQQVARYSANGMGIRKLSKWCKELHLNVILLPGGLSTKDAAFVLSGSTCRQKQTLGNFRIGICAS